MMSTTYNIKAIENGLRGIMQMVPRSSMSQLYASIDNSLSKLNEPMQLAIIGKISSSKSTLVNAILGKEEVMATGQKEVTYNVGWLKYGKPESDIIIHHKDGSPNSVKKKVDFSKWTVESNNREIDNVSYIETFDDAEILKEINIIDTPGLDALRGKDSENTLNFIKEVKPDAVLMLFTHSVSENVLDIVSQFNAGGSFTPLNAIGVLSKIDVLWQEDLTRKDSALKIAQRVTMNKLKKDLILRKTLFNLFPISSLLFLASSTIDESMLSLIKEIAKNDNTNLKRAFNSVKNFIAEDNGIALDSGKREILIQSVGLYGVYLIVQYIKQHADASLEEIKQLLRRESGANEFMKVLHNHFGSRAKLIKLESIFLNLQQSIKQSRAQSKDNATVQLLNNIQHRVTDLFSSLIHEHLEYEMLNKIYNNELDLEENVKNEFLCLCGEHGFSAKERLNQDKDTTPEQLLEICKQKENYWRRCVALEPDPDEREWMNVILSSYSRLRNQIKTMYHQYQQAQAFLYNI